MSDREKLERAEQWVKTHMSEFRQQYPGEWVAVLDDEVQGHHKDYSVLVNDMAERNQAFACYTYVYSEGVTQLWDLINHLFEK